LYRCIQGEFTGEGGSKKVENVVLGTIAAIPIVFSKDNNVLDAYNKCKEK